MQVHMPYMQGMYVTEASNSKEPLHFRENTVTPTSKFRFLHIFDTSI